MIAGNVVPVIGRCVEVDSNFCALTILIDVGALRIVALSAVFVLSDGHPIQIGNTEPRVASKTTVLTYMIEV